MEVLAPSAGADAVSAFFTLTGGTGTNGAPAGNPPTVDIVGEKKRTALIGHPL